jgi:hypothetical protein
MTATNRFREFSDLAYPSGVAPTDANTYRVTPKTTVAKGAAAKTGAAVQQAPTPAPVKAPQINQPSMLGK